VKAETPHLYLVAAPKGRAGAQEDAQTERKRVAKTESSGHDLRGGYDERLAYRRIAAAFAQTSSRSPINAVPSARGCARSGGGGGHS
jgi:hypothetical protein